MPRWFGNREVVQIFFYYLSFYCFWKSSLFQIDKVWCCNDYLTTIYEVFIYPIFSSWVISKDSNMKPPWFHEREPGNCKILFHWFWKCKWCPSWLCHHDTALIFAWRLPKSRKSFLQNFANGGHREFVLMIPRFFSSCLTLTKKSKFIFAKSRERWPSRICHHDAEHFFVLLDAFKKVEINFCKISRMVAVANSPSWRRD